MKTVRAHYRIATYAGSVVVKVDDDADREQIIAAARAKLRRLIGGHLPFGPESWTVVAEQGGES